MLTIEYDGITFTVNDIENLPNLYRVIDPISYDLEYDVFNFSVKSDAVGEQKLKDKLGFWLSTSADEGIVFDPGDFAEFVYGPPVSLYENGKLKAILYVTNIYPTNQHDRTKELFRVECVSAVGILSKVEHFGNVYNGATIGSVIAEIMGNLPYTIDSALAAELTYGWLPYVKDARQNLRKVLFPVGASILRNQQGGVHFAYNRPDVAKVIPTSRTFYGGLNVLKEHKSAVTVIEHGFYQSLEAAEELVFDNTNGAAGDNTRIVFDEPYYDYRGDGLTVVSSSANYAIVSGVGYLYAKKYVHTQRPMTAVIDNVGEPEILQVADQTLVSSLTINGVINRLANYYSTAKLRSFDIEVSDEEPGDLIQFTDRRGNTRTGYVKSLDETASSFWRGKLTAVTDWQPTPAGNDYTHYIIVKASDLVNGVWNVPEEAQGQRARVVLFSGAEGGQGGYAGETVGEAKGTNGNVVYTSSSGSNRTVLGGMQEGVFVGGKGGKGGKGGAAATRFINIDIPELAASYPATFGAGGEGGAGGTVTRNDQLKPTVTPPEYGSPGENSVFNGVSTANGALFRGTYMNLVTGEVLAQVGEDGTDGGDGGRGGYGERIRGGFETRAAAEAYDYSAIGKAEDGQSVGTYAGGVGANGTRGVSVSVYNWSGYATGFYLIGNAGGGGGGGAAIGAAGSAGATGQSGSARYTHRTQTATGYDEVTETLYYTNHIFENDQDVKTTYGARGGDGADASVIPAKPQYIGGHGGHGGGGGGAPGQCMANQNTWSTSDGTSNDWGHMVGGKGGNGGKGGDGSDGFMICYW